MATITRIDRVQRFIVDGDPTSGIPAVCNPGDRIYRQDTATEYVMTQAGVVAEASMDESPVFTSVSASAGLLVTGSAASPAGTVRYLGGADGGTSSVAINATTGGAVALRVAGTVYCRVSATDIQIGTAGGAFAISGRAATGTNTASGAITLNANTGTGTGAVGGYIIKVPVTTGSGTDAQTLTTALTVTATTTPLITIDGTYGAGVASLRMNGLTTAATADQTGTLTNAPSAGNPVFWMPVSIAGTVRYIPCWA